jgi:hypothetical protein
MVTMTWGRWTLNPSNACLETNITAPVGPVYQIPVDEMKTSANVLDWIFQIHEKTWVSSQDVGELVNAIVEILGRGICSGGIDRPIDPKVPLANRYGCKFQ